MLKTVVFGTPDDRSQTIAARVANWKSAALAAVHTSLPNTSFAYNWRSQLDFAETTLNAT